MKSFLEYTHIRRNILTGAQVLVSPHRTQRPWQGNQEKKALVKKIAYDPECYLCPGNKRASRNINPDYTSTFTFINDFSALVPAVRNERIKDQLFEAHSERGICKVICFSPDHSITLSQMGIVQIEKVIEAWQKEFRELSAYDFIKNVQIFENKGAMMGCSNPHPHGQIWAQETIPQEIEIKTKRFAHHREASGKSLLEDYLAQELKANQRVINENEHFVTLVPFWAVWPYETMIIPKRAMKHITEINKDERESFAKSIKLITSIYDKVFNISFPYSGGIHQAPVDNNENKGWHWHMSFYPPLLRSATVKKFMVGYEMFGMPQRDITPEFAAKTLSKLI